MVGSFRARRGVRDVDLLLPLYWVSVDTCSVLSPETFLSSTAKGTLLTTLNAEPRCCEYFFFPFNEFKKACTLNTYPKASLGPDPINTIMWKHYIGLYLFEWKFRHVLQCFLGRFMLSGLKAVLVLAANMTLGSLLLGRVSFHGIIHVGSLYANVRVNWSVWKMSFLSFQGANLIITKLPL